MPLQPFPSVPKKPTLKEVAADMPAPRTLGEKIRYLRIQKGMRQNELAKELGIYNTAVCQYEKDLTRPRPPHLARMAQLFGLPLSELEASATASG